MTVELLTALVLLLSLFSLIFKPPVAALSCYSFSTSNSTITSSSSVFLAAMSVKTNCFACEKTVMTTKDQSNYVWKCDKIGKSEATNGACKESILGQYFPNGPTIAYSCSCCTDKCNNAAFCNQSHPKIKKMEMELVAGYHEEGFASALTKIPAPISCYSGVIDSSYGGTPAKDFTKAAKVVANCKECRRTSVASASLLGNVSDEWRCEKEHASPGAVCRPYITATVFLDGSTSSISCSCCTDRCNTANLCQFAHESVKNDTIKITNGVGSTSRTLTFSHVPLFLTTLHLLREK